MVSGYVTLRIGDIFKIEDEGEEDNNSVSTIYFKDPSSPKGWSEYLIKGDASNLRILINKTVKGDSS
jgi:hypothetical protein